MSGMTRTKHKRHRTHGRDPVVVACVGAMVLVLALTVFFVVQSSGLRGAPNWWVRAITTEVGSESQATALENRISSAITRVRPESDSEWTAAIEEADLNAWIVHRLRPTVETHLGEGAWADEVERVRVVIDSGAVVIGARLAHGHGASVVWARLRVGVTESGLFEADIERAYIGTTRVPVSWARGYLTPEKLGRARIDLGDGREVVIRAVRAGDHRLEFALRTQKAANG